MTSTIGYDTTFELDKFSKPRVRSQAEIIKNVVMYILFSKPGQYPDLPMIGLDIESKLYSFYDEINEEELKMDIINQCSALEIFFDSNFINFRKVMYRNKPSLLIHIETTYEDSHVHRYTNDADSIPNRFRIGITLDELDRMIYNVL